MKPFPLLVISVCVAGATAATFTAGMAVASRDAKLFQAHDKQRMTLLARSCGKAGTLMQDPVTDDFSCVYRNADGQTIMRYVTDAPMLIVRN